MRIALLTFFAIMALAGGGCQSRARPAKAQPSSIVSTSVGPAAPASINDYPATVQPPIINDTPAQRVPFVVSPTYQKVYVKPYKDVHGRAVGPQEIVQQVDAGGINPAALDDWEHGYIPVNNMVQPPGMGSPITATAPHIESVDLVAANSPETVVVTGYYRPEDEPLVREMAKQSGKVVKWDSKLGWVLIQKQ